MIEATQLTGSPPNAVPRAGDVLAERYELLESVQTDGLTQSFRALDQEGERPVLVRVLCGDPLEEGLWDEVVNRLRAQIGVGGRYLASLLDADHERGVPFTVEPWPRGTQLSLILNARRTRGETLGLQEALPVIAQLCAALEALPDEVCHGDVRAECVWVDTDGLRLTGAHLVAALPPEVLRARMADLGPQAVAHPPELLQGRVDHAADRWGVAAIAWESLSGRSPDPASSTPEVGEPLRAILVRFLSDEPSARGESLEPLVRALATAAGLPIPRFDAEPHRPPVLASSDTQPRAFFDAGEDPLAEIPTPVVRAREIPGAATGGTQEIEVDQILEERGLEDSTEDLASAAAFAQAGLDADDTGKVPSVSSEQLPTADDTNRHRAVSRSEHPPLSSDDRDEITERHTSSPDLRQTHKDEVVLAAAQSLDPRLVRAALAASQPAWGPGEETEPAGLGALTEPYDGDDIPLTEHSSDIVPLDDDSSVKKAARPLAPPRRAGAAKPPSPGPDRPASGAPRPPPPRGPATSSGDYEVLDTKALSAQEIPSVEAPGGNTPAAETRTPENAAAESRGAESRGAESRGAESRGAEQMSGAAPGAPSVPRRGEPDGPAKVEAEASAASVSESGRITPELPPVGPRSTATDAGLRPTRRRRRSIAGYVIVLSALVLAALIVGAGFMIASRRRNDAARQRELERRWEEIQQQGNDSAEP